MGAGVAEAGPAVTRKGSVLPAALASALAFGLPLLLPPLAFLAAAAGLPLAASRVRSGRGLALLATGLAALLVALAVSPGAALAFVVLLAVPALLLAESAALGHGLLRGCGVAFLWLALPVAGAILADGPALAQRMLEPVKLYSSPDFLEAMRRSGVPAERVEELAEQFGALAGALAVVYPAVLLIAAGLLVLANAAALRFYLARRAPEAAGPPEFETLRWPLGLSVGFVGAGLLVLLEPARSLAYNGLLLLAFCYALQGLAVVAYYARRLAGPPLLRGALVLLVLVNPWAPQLLALMGLFDTWLELRRYADPPKEEGA
jgi:hypothetical protein